jgi:hypothetical protein
LKTQHFSPNNNRPKQRNNSGETAGNSSDNSDKYATNSKIISDKSATDAGSTRTRKGGPHGVKNHARDAIQTRSYVPGRDSQTGDQSGLREDAPL